MNDLIQHPATIPAAIFLLILIANLWVFFTREWEASHRAADYARINLPADVPSLRRWRIKGDRLYPEIIWNRQPTHWQIVQHGKIIETVSGRTPAITLAPPKYTGAEGTELTDFQQDFTLRPLPAGIGPDLIFNVTPIDRVFYRDRDMYFPKDLYRIVTDVPAGKFHRHNVSDWIDDYRYMKSAELAETDRILREEVGINDADNDLTLMGKIIHFMRTQLADAGGVPKNSFRWQNPLHIFNEMRHGTGKGWCTQEAQIFTLLANRAGVPTRFVHCGTVQSNQFIYDGHSWTESWLSEQNRWVYTDPQQAIIGVFNRDGTALNTADVFELCLARAFEGTQARIFKNWQWQDLPVDASPDTAVNVPFDLVNRVARKHFIRNGAIKYRRPPNVEDLRITYTMLFRDRTFAWANFKRYLWRSELAYSHLPTNGTCVYGLRQSLFAGLLASALWLICAAS